MLLRTCLLIVLLSSFAFAHDKPIRVLVWDEQQPNQKEAYGEKMLGNTIAEFLQKNPSLKVRSAAMPPKGKADEDPSLTPESLDQNDVLVWWGHVRHREVKWEVGDAIVERVKAGKLSMIAIHSAQHATPFIKAMNARSIDDAMKTIPEADRAKVKLNLNTPKYTSVKKDTPLTPSHTRTDNADGSITLTINLPHCVFPEWRHDAKPSKLTTLLPDHPIAKGIPAKWTISQTEMYNEPFHVPTPDAVIFDERFEGGEWFRGGMVWDIGKGKVFYFRPGHETYPVFKEELPNKVLENACVWLGEQIRGGK